MVGAVGSQQWDRSSRAVRPGRNRCRLPIGSGRKYDLVCANLIFDLLLKEAKRIVSRLKPEGVLVLAGILRAQFPMVRAAYEKHGLRLIVFKAEKEWAGGAFGSRG